MTLNNEQSIYLSPITQESDTLATELIDGPQILIFKNNHLLKTLCSKYPFEKHPNLVLSSPTVMRGSFDPQKGVAIFQDNTKNARVRIKEYIRLYT